MLLCALLWVFWGCAKSRDESRAPSGSASQTEAVKVFFTEGGRLQAILYANRLEERDGTTWGWDIKVDFFPAGDTIPRGGMVADSGFVLGRGTRRRTVAVFGDVVLVAPDGTKLFADSLRWNPKNHQIESGSAVRLVRGREVIEGVGFRSDPNFQHITVTQVRGKIEG